MNSDWIKEEFSGIDFRDERLNGRFYKVSTAFSVQPSAPINQACEDWAATKAAYRLFDNEKVEAEEILRVHQLRTVKRMQGYPLLLAVQDSTLLDYTSHPKKQGIGPIGTKEQQIKGLVMHSTLVFTPEGLPLGLLSQHIWARDEEEIGQRDTRKVRPIEDKESYKWLKALEECCQKSLEGIQLVSVCDRESDIYEFISQCEQLKRPFTIRAAQDRAIISPRPSTLWRYMPSEAIGGYLEIEVPAKEGQPARQAKAAIRFAKVKLRPPKREGLAGSHTELLQPVEVYVVYLREVDAPEDIEPIEWMLLTNVPVQNFQDAVERVSWYARRWGIEVYHKVIKSGCKVEDCRLETTQRLLPYLTLFSIIAWRLYWMTLINRHNPEAPCSLILAEHEWKALYCKIHKSNQLPPKMPTVGEAVRWIAQLGGFLGRRRDGDPGIIVVWRGWHRLHDIADTWLILKPG
ncbi:IS4 family transposase [Candidatus Parcubacteria bacterium]|nr:MAG: IS4 family transposase [Candidatus Parcubacteria bacterium]